MRVYAHRGGVYMYIQFCLSIVSVMKVRQLLVRFSLSRLSTDCDQLERFSKL